MRKATDLTGQRFGDLVVLGRAENKTKSKGAVWECICACGNKTVVFSANLRKGRSKRCADCRIARNGSWSLLDRIGERFGRLLVVELAGREPRGGAIWGCICCGSEDSPHEPVMVKIRARHLSSGRTLSCGCLLQDRMTRHEITRRFQVPGKSASATAKEMSISPNFLFSVASGYRKPDKFYHRFRNGPAAELTPDGRRSRMVLCAGCNTAFKMSVIRINRGEVPACPSCREYVAKGGRVKVPTVQPLMDAPKRQKERRRNQETLEIARIVAEVQK